MKTITLFVLLLILAPATAGARKVAPGKEPVRMSIWSDQIPRDAEEELRSGIAVYASAPATTLVLASYKFDSGYTCTGQGWTAVDITSQTGDWWHVDDFTGAPWAGTLSADGISFTPVEGAKSMWMAAVPPPANPVDFVLCGYLALPGYGNNWDQSFCSKTCLAVGGGATPNLDIAFKLKFDSEPSYDYTALEYTTDCSGNIGWTQIAGGNPDWSAGQSFTFTGSYAVGPGPVKVRLHFVSETAWSNQDGLYPGFGVAVDSLSAETTPVENFEDEALGSHTGNDWESCNTPGYGNYLALFKKADANYEDQCLDNVSCYWAALQGSTEFYTCGTPAQPGQKIVPHVNTRAQYLANEIWSPVIPFAGTGSEFRLRYTVYRDLPLDNLIFHVWHVRTIATSGCPGPWLDRNFVFYGDSKDWAILDNAIGSKVDLTGTAMQVAIGVIDMCKFWCGIYGTGACHSPAPYIDKVQVRRIDKVGPQWDVRDIDLFQDTFAANGTITGTARIDSAMDIKPVQSPSITPGDSAIVFYLVDPKYISGVGTNASGLLADPVVSTFPGLHKTKKQVYMYVAVWPLDPVDNPGDKIGEDMSEGPGGQANRHPFMGTLVANGVTWTKIRMDYTYPSPGPYGCDPGPCGPLIPNRFNVDLNDNLFTPGDTICYFYSATSADGTTYYSSEIGATNDLAAVAANPMEVTILPAGGFNRGGSILWVNGADGLIDQVYYYGAWFALGFNYLVDRYDVLAPSAGASNRPGNRVTNVANQLKACYDAIMWDCGPLSVTLGDGSGDPEKCDDYALLNAFLAGSATDRGVFLSGDDVAEYLNGYAGASAVTFRSLYMPFTLINDNHRLAPSLFRISPTIVPWPGRWFSDSFFVFGGCAELNDFDVIGSSGTSQVQMSYNTASNPNGAVVSNVNGHARVVMSGFSLATLRDNELDGIFDRAKFVRDVLFGLGFNLPATSGADDGVPLSRLSQNYPNPFNPQTTIAFSLAAKGHVSLRIYDVSGALVRILANEDRASGAQSATWDGRTDAGAPAASGVYFYKLVAGDFAQTKKMVLLK